MRRWKSIAAIATLAVVVGACGGSTAGECEIPGKECIWARAYDRLAPYDEAETIFQEAIARRPAFVDAHRDLAQLGWMRTADLDHALAPLKATLANCEIDIGRDTGGFPGSEDDTNFTSWGGGQDMKEAQL